jgi:hypothetical protein
MPMETVHDVLCTNKLPPMGEMRAFWLSEGIEQRTCTREEARLWRTRDRLNRVRFGTHFVIQANRQKFHRLKQLILKLEADLPEKPWTEEISKYSVGWTVPEPLKGKPRLP